MIATDTRPQKHGPKTDPWAGKPKILAVADVQTGFLGFYDWPEFGELAGARFGGEFMGPVTVVVEDPCFPGADSFGSTSFSFSEQHPILKEPYSRESVNVIMRIDPESIDPVHRIKRRDEDFPVVWSKSYGKGRIFHVGWGHLESTWDDRRFQRLILEGIKWAMGP